MTLRLELSRDDANSLVERVFQGNAKADATAVIGGGIEITNLTGSGRGFTAHELVTFVFENYQGIAANLAAAAIYDVLKGSGKSVLLNSRRIFSKDDVQKVLDERK